MPTGNLVGMVSKTVFGTAVRGFGFSLGHDVYRNLKKKWAIVLIILILLSTIVLPMLSSSKSYRWYPINKLRWFFSKLIPWLGIGLLGMLLLYYILDFLSDTTYYDELVVLSGVPLQQALPIFTMSFWSFLYILGFFDGLRRRRMRKKRYSLEDYNQDFLDNIGITEVDGSNSFTHMDADGYKLRMEGMGKDLIEFFVVGKRNKRSYLYLDETGKFTQYSGIVNL